MTGEIAPAGEGREPAVGRGLRASYEDRDKVAEQLRVAAWQWLTRQPPQITGG